ncbi:10000_t:CDS:2, partial [Dentiscutata erythropus]
IECQETQEHELLEELWLVDIAQALITLTKSKILVFIYYLALQSLQRTCRNYIRSRAIELLIALAARHSMFLSEFKVI